jgi:type I restriction enzyme R subunit
MARTEAQTRSVLIGSLLAQSGWNLKDPTQVIEEFDILTTPPEGVSEPHTPYEGHQFSDYVLLGKDRMTQTITRIERARPAWHRIDNGRFCHNLATRFTTVSVAVTSRKVLQQIAIRIEPYQTRWDAT